MSEEVDAIANRTLALFSPQEYVRTRPPPTNITDQNQPASISGATSRKPPLHEVSTSQHSLASAAVARVGEGDVPQPDPNYSPEVGIRIGVILVLALVSGFAYVIYKSKCKRPSEVYQEDMVKRSQTHPAADAILVSRLLYLRRQNLPEPVKQSRATEGVVRGGPPLNTSHQQLLWQRINKARQWLLFDHPVPADTSDTDLRWCSPLNRRISQSDLSVYSIGRLPPHTFVNTEAAAACATPGGVLHWPTSSSQPQLTTPAPVFVHRHDDAGALFPRRNGGERVVGTTTNANHVRANGILDSGDSSRPLFQKQLATNTVNVETSDIPPVGLQSNLNNPKPVVTCVNSGQLHNNCSPYNSINVS